ncbi:Glycoside Hydrolase Family 61, partial [Rhizoctonia solani]
MRAGAIIAALAAASAAHAHATFQNLWVDGVDEGTKCVRAPANNSPITDLTSNTLACNTNGEVAAAATCPVEAGTKVAVEMHQQPNDRNCATEAIGGNHDGPTIIYMAKVDNAATAVGSEASWFKVAETGLVSKDYWGTDVMNANCGKVEFTIPADLPAGNYLIRAEVIALHVAGSVGGAQLYMSCYQINVTGGGAASPATVKFPGAYSPTDPGILFNIYGSYDSYTIPGPAVYSGGSSPAPTTAAPSAPSSTAVAPSSTLESSESAAEPTVEPSSAPAPSSVAASTEPAPSSSTIPTTSAATSSAPAPISSTQAATSTVATVAPTSAPPEATGAVAAKWYQCGGVNWTGPTACVQGTTCKAQNPPVSLSGSSKIWLQ